jgi:hypothetical protein
MGGVMFIGYAIEPLRAEAPLHAASTLAVGAVLAAGRISRDSGGTATMWANPMRPWHVPRDSDCGECLWRFCPEDAALRRTSSLRFEPGAAVRPPMGARSKPRLMGGDAFSLQAKREAPAPHGRCRKAGSSEHGFFTLAPKTSFPGNESLPFGIGDMSVDRGASRRKSLDSNLRLRLPCPVDTYNHKGTDRHELSSIRLRSLGNLLI